MASWKEERDRLVAQTLAFVQQVASAHPHMAQRAPTVLQATQPTTSERAISAAPLVGTLPGAARDATAPSLEQTSLEQMSRAGSEVSPTFAGSIMSVAQTTVPVNPALFSAKSERADIEKRVAAFKARQSQFMNEREAYYETMQARIRTTLGNESRGRTL